MKNAHAAGERGGFPAGDRHGVDVAEEVEDNGLAVGADVEGHPVALAGGEVERACGL
jgi:hypothetical protein